MRIEVVTPQEDGIWFEQWQTLVGAIGLGFAVTVLVVFYIYRDIEDGVKGRESFTGNVMDFFVRMAGMNFWHTRAVLIVGILLIVMLVATIVVLTGIQIFGSQTEVIIQ